ncbi:MAG: regulatory protein TetR [Solirubrobacterales bacterium]|nr:regulatory protein TetR [Solirubrobacterales bacterium]
MDGMTLEAPTQTRPGGRSARVRAAVHRAAQELLAGGPADALTIPLIAAGAGVHPTTVYRRWGTLGELLADVASSRFSGGLVVPDTGSLRGDLEQWAAGVATDLRDPKTLAIMRAAIGAAGVEGGSACVADRHEQLEAMLERARCAGETDVPDREQAADALLGPLYYRAIFGEQPGSPAWARGLVPRLLG